MARAVVHAMSSTGRVAPQPCPDIVLAGCLVAVVFGGAKRALLQAFSERPNLFPCLAYAVKEGIPIAKRCLRDLNLHHHFPKQVVDVYLRYRPLVPLISKPGDDVLAIPPRREYWRCPSLEELDEDERDNRMKKECRWARRRARAAEKHRAVVGAYPRRVRVAKLNRAPRDGEPYKPMKSSPHVREISKGLDTEWWISFSHRR